MRLAILTMAAVVTANAGAVALAQPLNRPDAAQPAPSSHLIATEPSRLELGWMLPETTREGTVTLTNTSDRVVNLLRVTSSCTCTVGELTEDQKILSPGESTELSVMLKSGANTGPMVQRAYVWYEGSRAPFELFVAADVSLPVKTDPTFVNLLGASKAGKIRLESLDGEPFRVTSVDGLAPVVFDADGNAVDASEARTEFLVQFDYTGVADSDLDRWFMIETDHEGARELPLRVLHTSLYQVDNNRPTWAFGRDRFILGRMKAGDSVEREILLKRVGAPEDVTGIGVTHEGLDAEILETTVKGNELIVTVRFVATGGATGLIKSRLEITAEGQTHGADVIARVEAAS